jgi:hypothetical protein
MLPTMTDTAVIHMASFTGKMEGTALELNVPLF